MRALGTDQFTFANVTGLAVTGRPGLTRRLVFTLRLEGVPQFWDDNDPERLLHAMQLIGLDGDCWLETVNGRALVAALRVVSPALPLAQSREAREVALALGVDLSPELYTALLCRSTESPAFYLELRGLFEVWSNPLYDHDGYQTTRVGDSGLSRAIQQIGARKLVALHDSDQQITLREDEWARVKAELG